MGQAKDPNEISVRKSDRKNYLKGSNTDGRRILRVS
jgi:hypothetical protein